MNSSVCLLVLLVLQLTASAYSHSYGRYSRRVIQKDDTIRRHKRMHEPDCMFDICQNVPDYPDSRIENIIKKHPDLHTYFGGNVIQPSIDVSFGPRTGEEPQEPPLPFCRTRDVSFKPQKMIDVDQVERTIPNIKNYSQVLKFQVCDGKDCFPNPVVSDARLPADYETSCVQKYIEVKLVTVDVENGVPEHRKFRIPSTCVCAFTKSVD